MALRVWLPLNGSLENKGISGIEATALGTPTIDINGKIGKCYKIGTASSSIILPANAMTSFTECSLAFWIKINSWNTSYATYFQAGLNSTPWAHYIFGILRNNANSNLCFTISNGSSASNANYTTSNLELNTWYHLTFTYTAGKCSIYINGEFYKEYTTSIVPNFSGITNISIGRGTNNSSYQTDCYLNDFRLYDHCLSAKEVKEISQGLVLHYKLSNSSITNFSETGNLIPNYKEMGLGTANVTTGTWRTAGANNMTRTRVQIADSPVGECYCFQNSGIQTANDGSCYGIDNTTYFEPNTEYRISMFARITAGTEGYAGYNIYNISSELGGSHTKIDKNYRVTPLSADGSWTYCWYHFKTNSTATRNIYIGITTGETSVTTQMCLVRIEKWNEGMNSSIIIDSSGYGNDGNIIGNALIQSDSPRYDTSIYMNNTGTANHIEYNALSISGAFTISFWVKAALSKNQVIFIDNGHGYEFGILNNLFYTSTTTNKGWATSKFLTNNWNHIVIKSSDGTTTELFINGIQETSRTGANNNYLHNKTNPWLLNRGNNSSYAADANLSDFRIYATALSAEDVLDLYHTPANIDNLDGIHGFEFVEDTLDRELLALPWTSSYSTHNKTSISTNYNDKHEWYGNISCSASSDYIKINPTGKTYYYDTEISVAAGNQFYIGFERYDENKTSRSNNACVYIVSIKPTSDIIHQRYFGTVNLATDGVNLTDTITLRILNAWSGTTSGSTKEATIHYLSLREVTGKPQTGKIKQQGQIFTSELAEREKQASIYENGFVGGNTFIEK